MVKLELQQCYSIAALVSPNSCTDTSSRAICRGERPRNWKLWKEQNARNPFSSTRVRRLGKRDPYSLVIVAESLFKAEQSFISFYFALLHFILLFKQP